MQKTTLLLAVALAFSASSWAQDVKINGTGVSLEANKTPIHTAKNPQAIALLPKDLHLAVPGKFTVAVAALNSPPLTVFADDNKTLLGSETDIARLVAETPRAGSKRGSHFMGRLAAGGYLRANMMPRSAILPSPKSAKRSSNFATYRKDSLGFYVKKHQPLSKIDKAEDIAGLKIIVGSGTNQEAILLAWNAENVKKGLKPFTPVYTKDDAAQTLALQTGRADAFLRPNVIARGRRR